MTMDTKILLEFENVLRSAVVADRPVTIRFSNATEYGVTVIGVPLVLIVRTYDKNLNVYAYTVDSMVAADLIVGRTLTYPTTTPQMRTWVNEFLAETVARLLAK